MNVFGGFVSQVNQLEMTKGVDSVLIEKRIHSPLLNQGRL
jgi:hypothetical protein